MKTVSLSVVKDDLSRFLRLAAKDEIVITRHGKAAGVLIGFKSEDDWFDYRLENDSRFLGRIAKARASLRAGLGVHLGDIDAGKAASRSVARRRKKTGGSPAASSELNEAIPECL